MNNQKQTNKLASRTGKERYQVALKAASLHRRDLVIYALIDPEIKRGD